VARRLLERDEELATRCSPVSVTTPWTRYSMSCASRLRAPLWISFRHELIRRAIADALPVARRLELDPRVLAANGDAWQL
jgi:hypothetical protein